MFLEVESVTECGVETTYDIQVNPQHEFIANGFVVHNCMGRLHPHGDKSIYDTYVGMVNNPMPLIDGIGNWGTMFDPQAAAQRYTNMRLSAYADKVFLDKFYLAVMEQVPNYDDKQLEPLILPALLPNLLLNGTFGIGVGVSVDIPSFTLDSVTKIAIKVLKGEKCDAKMCMSLDFTTKYGGYVDKSEQKAEILNLYKTGQGSVEYDSVYEFDEKKAEMLITGFALGGGFEKALDKCLDLDSVASANDISDVADKYGSLIIRFKKSIKGDALEEAVSNVAYYFSTRIKHQIYITDRFKDNRGLAAAKFRPGTIPDIINDWCAYRIKLEKDACAYWIIEVDKDISYIELLRKAVANRKLILQALDKDLDDSNLALYLSKQLKVTVEEANKILDLKVRQLKALEDTALKDKLKKSKDQKAVYVARKAKPANYIVDHIGSLLTTLNGKTKEA